MCGRHAFFADLDTVKRSFQIDEVLVEYTPAYNIAPTEQTPIVIEAKGLRKLYPFRWGLIPHWIKDVNDFTKSRPLINARQETVGSNGLFRESFERRRCLIPSNGYYEWKRLGAGKQAYFLHNRDQSLMAFAGIYDRWLAEDGRKVYSYAIVTTDANEDTRFVHDRMPVMLRDGNAEELWLNNDHYDFNELSELFNSEIYQKIDYHKVSSAVNATRPEKQDHAGLVQVVD